MRVAELNKRINNIKKKESSLGCNDPDPPLHNRLECNRLKLSKQGLTDKLQQAKKSSAAKIPGRPRGRPPMKCEDIQKKLKIKDPAKKQAALDKKCAKRASKSYEPYKCTSIDGKCMTISKTYTNPVFEK